jgi:DNA-binding transcriptional ArsR family regulator
MSTIPDINKLGTTLFGKTRRAVLALLYSHPDESFYLRQLARMTGVGMGALQRELKQLSEAGIIIRNEIGRQAFFKANPACPVYSELRDIITKTFGVADILREALLSVADKIRVAFIFGSMVSGEFNQGSDVDVIVIGDISFAEVVSALSPA